MNKILKQILILICLIAVLILPYFVFAQETAPLKKLKDVGVGEGKYAEATEYTISMVLGWVINSFLSFLGVIFIILMITAGYNWMTAAGDEEKINKAKETIRRAIIGLFIVVSALAIWNFIFVNIIA